MKYIVITSQAPRRLRDVQVRRPARTTSSTRRRSSATSLKELADACARGGIRLGFYYSQSQDWHEPNGAGNTWDFGPDDKKDYDQYLRGKAEPQVQGAAHRLRARSR